MSKSFRLGRASSMACRAGFVLALAGISVTTQASEIVFGAIGDFGDGSSAEARVAGVMAGWNPDFIVTLGDNRYGSTNFDLTVGQFFCAHLADVASGAYCSGGDSAVNAFFPSAGNHDYSDGNGINEYLRYFTLPGAGVTTSGTSGSELYYDFVQGPVHFFVLDSESALDSRTEMSAQQNWLQRQLAASTAPWQIVVLHHAPYSSGSHGSNEALQWPYAAWGADAVLAGHDHVYERLEADGIPYFVNGLGGKSIYEFDSALPNTRARYNRDYGAMRISADDSRMKFEFINTSGAIIDSHLVEDGGNGNSAALRIIEGSDDVEERLADGSVYVDSSDLELGSDPGQNGDQVVGLRFRGLPIPAGATIESARLEFTVDETDGDATEVRIGAQAVDDAPAFGTGAFDVTRRQLTVARVPWKVPAWNNAGAVAQSPDLTPVIQEVVNRSGWRSGNDMVLVIEGTGTRTAESFEGSSAGAPLLRISYSTGASGNEPPNAAFSYRVTDLTAAFSDASSDPDGDIVDRAWDFGDGAGSSASDPTHTYDGPGTYAVSLTVTDDQGATDTSTQSVTVANTVLQPPVAPSNLKKEVEYVGKKRDRNITSATLYWTDNSGNEDGFVVERCEIIVTWTNGKRVITCEYGTYGTVAANVTELAVEPPESGYAYRVRAFNDAGYSSHSNRVAF